MRIVVADDHPLLRRALIGLLKAEPAFECIGEAADASEIMEFVRLYEFDVLILDLSMPGQRGLELVSTIRREKPLLAILVLSSHPTEPYAAMALCAGANAYVPKDRVFEDLIATLARLDSQS